MQARNDITYIYELYKQSINTQKFLLIFLISSILSIYGILAIAFGSDYITGFYSIFSGGIYLAGLFLVILLNTINIYSLFEDNYFLIIRFSTKKEYLEKLIKTICVCNLFTLILNIMFVIIGLNLFCPNDFTITLKSYNFPGWIYLLYMIIKLIILSTMINIINVCLLKIMNNKVVIFLNILLYIGIAGSPIYIFDVISTISQIPLFIGTYLKHQLYSSFALEMSCFFLYVTFLYLVGLILKRLALRNMKRVVKT